MGVKSKSSTFQAKSEEEELQEALFLSALDAQKDAHKVIKRDVAILVLNQNCSWAWIISLTPLHP